MRDNTSTARLDKTPLYGPCAMCGAPDGVIYRHPEGHTEHLCSHCAQRGALYTAAYDQLEVQIRGAVEAWLSIWGTLPGVVDLSEQLSQLGHKLDEEQREHQ